jgi:oxidoreductase
MSESSTAKTSSGSAIIFGGTGAVGKHLVSELLQSPQYNYVHAFVRKSFKAESLHKDSSKLVEHVIDFDKLMQSDHETVSQVKKVGAEAVYITCAYIGRGRDAARYYNKVLMII